MAKGVCAYQADDEGAISLILRRAVEWLTEPDLEHRAGDAGPVMYVPDARCERTVQHEIAVLMSETSIDDLTIHQWNAGFQSPPLIVISPDDGEQTEWPFLKANLPLSSLHLHNNKLLARFYNPTSQTCSLEQEYLQTDVWGNPKFMIKEVPAKDIITVGIAEGLPAVSPEPIEQVVTWVAGPTWRVGRNQGRPAPEIVRQLEEKISQLENQLAQVEAEMNNANEHERYVLQHTYYVVKREL